MTSKDKKDQFLWDYHQTINKDNFIPNHPRQEMLLGKAKKIIKKGKVLEIGFGEGYLLSRLSKAGFVCYGADISEPNVEQMKIKAPDVQFDIINTDGNLPYENECFDGFIASEVLEHMSDKELKVAVQEMKRVLKKGSYALITVPAQENMKAAECFCPNCGEVFHKWGHKQYWDSGIIKKVFKDFEIINIYEFFIPYTSGGIIERLIGRIIYLARVTLNKFVKLENRSYFILLKKA